MLNGSRIMSQQRFVRQTIKANKPAWLGALALVVFAALIAVPGPTVNAQTESPWMPDQRIPGYRDNTFTPFLLADQNGYVHAFASQSAGDGEPVGIVYRKWSLKSGWTTPVDILLSPIGDAVMPSAFLDSKGILHLVFYGGNQDSANIYYSSAPVESANSIRAWSTPAIIGDSAVGPPYAALTGDEDGNLVMIYTGDLDGGGVYSVQSSDSGLTWSKPAPVYLVDDPNLIPFSLRLSPGRDGQVHAAWNVVTATGGDISLHYARFDFGTLQWTAPIVLNEILPSAADSFGPSYPSVADNGSEVIVMYNNGNPLPSQRAGLGRPIQMVSLSKDNGDTWEPPTVPFIRLEGRSGEHVLVQDSDNIVHALFVQRTAGGSEVLGGIWESEYQNGFWSDPNRFVPTYSAHDLRAVVSQGNVLLMAWRLDPGVGQKGIWYTYKILDSKELPIASYPTRPPDASVQAEPTVALVPTATRTPIPKELLNQPRSGVSNPGSSIGFGILAVSLILLVIVVLFAKSRSRQ